MCFSLGTAKPGELADKIYVRYSGIQSLLFPGEIVAGRCNVDTKTFRCKPGVIHRQSRKHCRPLLDQQISDDVPFEQSGSVTLKCVHFPHSSGKIDEIALNKKPLIVKKQIVEMLIELVFAFLLFLREGIFFRYFGTFLCNIQGFINGADTPRKVLYYVQEYSSGT